MRFVSTNSLVPVIAAAAAALALPGTAGAVVIVTGQQVGGDVVFSTPGGSLNLGGLTFAGTVATSPGIQPTGNDFVLGSAGNADYYFGFSSPPFAFGLGGSALASLAAGNLVGIKDLLVVPKGYVSGSALGAASATFSGATYLSLGIQAGTYNFTWLANPTTLEYVQLVIEPVPVPAAAWLFASALGVLGWLRRPAR